jgi:starvation-inducible DNA-binding protein
MNNVQPFRPAGYVEDNPLGLPKDYVKKILPHLDAHIASLFVLFHQYQKHHWLVEGPQFMDLHKFLQGNYEQVHKQIDMLAERMTALGGIPTCNPVEQAKIAYFEHEPEGTYRIRHMLERDLEAEGILARKLREDDPRGRRARPRHRAIAQEHPARFGRPGTPLASLPR